MPKDEQPSMMDDLLPSCMVVRCETRRVLMIRPSTYEELLDKIRNQFLMPPGRDLRLLGTVSGTTDFQFFEIGKTLWAADNTRVKTIKVETPNDPNRVNLDAPMLPLGVTVPATGIPAKRTEMPPTRLDILEEQKPVVQMSTPASQVPSPAPITPTTLPIAMMTQSRISATPKPDPEKITLYISPPAGVKFGLQLRPESTFERVFQCVATKIGCCEKDLRLFTEDSIRIVPHNTPEDLDVEHGHEILVRVVQLGGKPVIYLYPPQEMDVSVRLGLVSQWRFSTLYPPTPVKETALGQSTEWSVRARPDGLIKDIRTGIHASYLFWEAETEPTIRPNSPPASRPPTPTGVTPPISYQPFTPTSSHCSPSDSVLLEVHAAPLYLDRALSTLGLHVEARTSFITYWLPSMLKHSYIAARFVPQRAYEASAPLTITPHPDAMTRVFMLFQGVRNDSLDDWAEAASRATEDVTLWRDVVGIPDVERQKDARLFRVLEWGGMEVLGH